MINTASIILSGDKLKAFPLMSGTMVPTLTNTIQHSFGSFSHSNQRRKKKIKGIQIGKGEVKLSAILSLFADDMILLMLLSCFSHVRLCATP